MTAAAAEVLTPGIMSSARALAAVPPPPPLTNRTPSSPSLPKDAIVRASRVITARPHLSVEPRPPVACCKACRNKPLYNPDLAAEAPFWFATGLTMSVAANA